jgi:hypothetical protein
VRSGSRPPPLAALSPAKKIGRSSAAFLTEADIIRDLDAMLGDATPPSPAKSKKAAGRGAVVQASTTPSEPSPPKKKVLLSKELKQVQVYITSVSTGQIRFLPESVPIDRPKQGRASL